MAEHETTVIEGMDLPARRIDPCSTVIGRPIPHWDGTCTHGRWLHEEGGRCLAATCPCGGFSEPSLVSYISTYDVTDSNHPRWNR